MLGHNKPPAIDVFGMALDDLYSTAQDFLDGAAIETQGQADAIGKIINEAKKIRKYADAARAEEKRPHDEAAKAVQVKWKPLLERCESIETAAKAPLTAWLNRQAEEQRERERIAREAAEQAAREAQEAHRASIGNLAAVETAKELDEAAEAAAKDARRAAKAKPQVTGMDRAIGLRTYWTGTVENHRELLEWLLKNEPATVKAWLDDYARRSVANGTRWLPGVTITEQRKVA